MGTKSKRTGNIKFVEALEVIDVFQGVFINEKMIHIHEKSFRNLFKYKKLYNVIHYLKNEKGYGISLVYTFFD
jgi:hypothetical protein